MTAEKRRRRLSPPLLMGGSRATNILTCLLLIPLILHFLGPEQFAAWALYTSGAMAFTTLEFGLARTLVRFLAPPLARGDRQEADQIATGGLIINLAVYGGALLVCLPWIAPLVHWLGLPDPGALTAETTFMLVLGAVAIRAILGVGGIFIYAAQDFHQAAALAFLQPFLSNLAAMAAAAAWQRLDLVLLCYWAAQLAVVGAALLAARWKYHWRLALRRQRLDSLRPLFVHAFQVQMGVWSQTVNLHFDKFIIAGFIGLEAVVPYEIASRAVMSLRSIPASAIETFLPTASVRNGATEEHWHRYRQMTGLAARAVALFILAPLAVAPFFLYAWIGPAGLGAQPLFALLAVGVAIELLALPAVTWQQAQSRPEGYARASLLAVLINIPANLALLQLWGAAGAAAGTALALALAHLHFLHRFLRDWPARPRIHPEKWLRPAVPPLLLCIGLGLLTTQTFDWLLALSPWPRLAAALAGGLLYATCALGLIRLSGLATPGQ
jgi:O-antigen/teichoic acid export membrane protein